MTADDTALRIISMLDADEPIDWEAEGSALGMTGYRLQLLVRHVWATRGDTPESTEGAS